MSLSDKETSDVLVIGGGVIGMSIARELKKCGAGKVTLLERERLGQEASFAAAGMLTPQADAEKRDVFFDLCCAGRDLYEGFAEELRSETGIDIELETSGTLSLSFSEKDSAQLEKIFSWQNAAGLPVEKLNAREILEREPFLSTEIREGLFFPRDVQVENRLLVAALETSIKRAGVKIFEGAQAETLLIENGKIIGAATSTGKFFAPVVVLATGAWSSFIKTDESSRPLLKVFPIRGQMLSFHPERELFRRVVISNSGYLVPRADGRVLVGATVENAGFDTNVTTEGVEYLLKAAYELAPGLKNFEIVEKWAGLRPVAVDKLPILGGFNGISGLYVATAHYRNGILLAPITAKIMADEIISHKRSLFLDKFGVGRFTNAASG